MNEATMIKLSGEQRRSEKNNSSPDLCRYRSIPIIDPLAFGTERKPIFGYGIPERTDHGLTYIRIMYRDTLTDGALIYMDETVLHVLKEANKTPSSSSYMWVQTGGPPGKPVILYGYDQSRSGSVPLRLL